MKKRFTGEQIIPILKEAETGLPVKELCRKYNISDATFYIWRKEYGGLEVSEARRVKALEEERAPQEVAGRVHAGQGGAEGGSQPKVLTVGNKREAVRAMLSETTVSERKACSLVGLSRATMRYQSQHSSEERELTERIKIIAFERRRFGYRRAHQPLRREGVEVNHRKVYRLYGRPAWPSLNANAEKARW